MAMSRLVYPPAAIDPIDIWRTAHILMKEYGEEAALIAARRSDAFLEQGDVVASQVWTRVFCAIDELQRGSGRASRLN